MSEGAEGTPEAAPEGKAEPTFTQEQVNDLIAKEKGKIQSRYEGFDDLKAKAAKLDELEEANATELDKARKAAEKAQKEAAAAATELLRFRVAQEKEIPAKLVPLLTATDKESLEAQADLILENAKPENPDFNGGAREPAPEPKTPEQGHNDLIATLLGARST